MKRALILVTFLRIDFVQPLTLRFGQDFQVEVREFLGAYMFRFVRIDEHISA